MVRSRRQQGHPPDRMLVAVRRCADGILVRDPSEEHSRLRVAVRVQRGDRSHATAHRSGQAIEFRRIGRCTEALCRQHAAELRTRTRLPHAADPARGDRMGARCTPAPSPRQRHDRCDEYLLDGLLRCVPVDVLRVRCGDRKAHVVIHQPRNRHPDRHCLRPSMGQHRTTIAGGAVRVVRHSHRGAHRQHCDRNE